MALQDTRLNGGLQQRHGNGTASCAGRCRRRRTAPPGCRTQPDPHRPNPNDAPPTRRVCHRLHRTSPSKAPAGTRPVNGPRGCTVLAGCTAGAIREAMCVCVGGGGCPCFKWVRYALVLGGQPQQPFEELPTLAVKRRTSRGLLRSITLAGLTSAGSGTGRPQVSNGRKGVTYMRRVAAPGQTNKAVEQQPTHAACAMPSCKCWTSSATG